MAEIRNMTPAELETVLDWAADEGWNPGQDDVAAFHAADPHGFFVAVEGGAPVAAISVVNHTDELAFLGLYICRPEWRGRGVGLRLWQHALAHAEERCVGLDGVPAQQANYARSGFATHGETRRYEGVVPGRADPDVRDAAPDDVPALVRMDTLATGYGKPGFMTRWLAASDTRRTLVLERGGTTEGFATLRRCRTGSKIGPLVARDMEAAERLFLAAAAQAAPGPVILDVPDSQPELVALCERLGMTCSFTTARMYRGVPPRPAEQLVTSIATMELG